MKIAFFHELHFGGARRVVIEYGKQFSKEHHVSSYYTSVKREEDLESIFNKTYFYSFFHTEYEGNDWIAKIRKDYIDLIKLYFLHKKIARDIDKQKFDFVLVHLSRFTHAPLILRFLKTPTFYYCQEPLRIVYDPVVRIPSNINLVKKTYEILNRQVRKYIDYTNARSSDLILANSNYSKNNIFKAYGKKAELAYLGVDSVMFKPLNLNKVYDLIFVGNDVWMEGYDLLEEIEKMFKNKIIVKVIKPEKGKYISDEDLVKEYNKSKICVVFGRHDPFTMIPLEAMACEVPSVVVNEGGGVEAIINGKNGYLVNRYPSEIYELLTGLLKNKEKREEIGRNGRKEVVSFWTWKKSYERLIKVMKRNL